jgi:hypothetical protein
MFRPVETLGKKWLQFELFLPAIIKLWNNSAFSAFSTRVLHQVFTIRLVHLSAFISHGTKLIHLSTKHINQDPYIYIKEGNK